MEDKLGFRFTKKYYLWFVLPLDLTFNFLVCLFSSEKMKEKNIIKYEAT